ncbi:16S rRNA (cytosine(1402)-N(4))-methyltransferase RsmH [Patescibacteria group bacterium]|nr:16S rRNA (cytosine(1402)-N(4))-methyltransferase RsmH [Patescibacteria group bacterium]
MHIPVLQKEVLKYLAPKANQNFIDCTTGEGGHSLAILEKIAPHGKVLGIDWNLEIIKIPKYKILNTKYEKRSILICDNFANLKKIVKKCNFKKVQGILFDLGISSWHLEESGRGFSFLRNEPLDMRYNVKSKILTAEEIVNDYPEKKLEKILREYGEERFAKKIAKEIIKNRKIRKIETTFQLVEIIKKAVPAWYRYPRTRTSSVRDRKKIPRRHFATKTFQALRIVVNDELNNFKKALPQTLEILEPQGRLVIISFHSLEDRISKNFLRDNSRKGLLKILTKKLIKPSKEEILINPRSRSAKLRAAKKT